MRRTGSGKADATGKADLYVTDKDLAGAERPSAPVPKTSSEVADI
jgi:hypothetical protein